MTHCISIFLLVAILPSVVHSQPSYVLTGTQKEPLITLAASKMPYVLRGDYFIPAAKQLEIQKGARIVAEKGSGISAAGKLTISGTQEAPVIFTPQETGQAYWEGIKIQKSDESKVHFTFVSGAKIGINIYNCKPNITGCVIRGNNVGVKAGEYGTGSHVAITNCVITDNAEDGVLLMGSSADLYFCTVSHNGGWGIRGEYYASPKITGTVITGNKLGGLFCRYYVCKVQAHGCVIENNADCNVQNGCPEDWDFSGNWWGKANTQRLIAYGDTANLVDIMDGYDKESTGKVRLGDFLRAPPQGCGSTLKFKLAR